MKLSICFILMIFLNPHQADSLVRNSHQIYKVAFIAGFSGQDPHTAKELFRGVETFSARYPEKVKAMSISKFDTRGVPGENLRIMNRLKSEDYRIFISAAGSDDSIAAAKYANANDLLLLVPFATNKMIEAIGPNIFQICVSDEKQGRVLAELTRKKLGAKKVVVITNIDSKYSTGLTEDFVSEWNRISPIFKGQSLSRINFGTDTLDISTISSKVAIENPDYVVITDVILRSSLIVKAINKLNSKIKFVGGDGFGGKKILSGIFGDTPVIQLYHTSTWTEDIQGLENDRFKATYRTLFSSDRPNSVEDMVYDTLRVLSDSISISKGNRVEDLADGILRMNHQGTTGIVSFVKKKRPAQSRPVAVIKLENGKYDLFSIER